MLCGELRTKGRKSIYKMTIDTDFSFIDDKNLYEMNMSLL